MTLPSVLGCQVCSALEKQNVPKDKVFFGAKCASADSYVLYVSWDQCAIPKKKFGDVIYVCPQIYIIHCIQTCTCTHKMKKCHF